MTDPLTDLTELRIVEPFPRPPATVRQALAKLSAPEVQPTTDDPAADEDALRRQRAERAKLPRPWVPASCQPKLRRHIWIWLDRVAAWVNHEYPWQPEKMIPACWVAHPHIAHELAVLACLRVAAERAYDPIKLEEWHRHSLPLFLDRMAARLATSCSGREHVEWPGRPRYLGYRHEDSAARRRSAIDQDTKHSDDHIDSDEPPSWMDAVTGESLDEPAAALLPRERY